MDVLNRLCTMRNVSFGTDAHVALSGGLQLFSGMAA
jgi:hypothetical protein